MRNVSNSLAASLAVIGLAIASSSAFAQIEKAKTLTTFWSFPKEQQAITLLIQGKAEPVTFNVSPDLPFGGVCIHCMLNQPFKVSESKAMCKPCGCGKTNAVCTAWKDLKQSTWEEIITSLPIGTVLRANFNKPDDAASGLKSLWIERRVILVPVDGLAGKSPAELSAIAKAVSGTKAEIDGDKRLLISNLKNDWDADGVGKLKKALEKVGAKIVRPEAPTSGTE